MKTQWIVHKFGGTSVASADRYKKVAGILREGRSGIGRTAVVVSAMATVTDALIDTVNLAKARNETYLNKLDDIEKKHQAALQELCPSPELVKRFHADVEDIREILRGVWLTRTCEERTVELVSGHGEVWSAQLLNAYLGSLGMESSWLDARAVLTVEPKPSTVAVDFSVSQAKLDAWLQECSTPYLVITGFVASTKEGIPTTLKRNGSDFSASIFGALLKASSIIIWTDVDGVLSADPRLVPEAIVLDELSYHEASELAYFGAKVVHPNTMAPVIHDKIPIWIKNTFRPELPGTKIHDKAKSPYTVKGFATIDHVSLINVEGTGMVGVPGVANTLFGALREVGVSVIVISQASSEHSICFAVPGNQSALAKRAVEEAFYAELHQGQIQTIAVHDDCCILAAVGDNMVERPGVAGEFFRALGQAGVNIRAIAQGSSERNISAVIDQAEARKALRAVHAMFFLSNHTLSIGLIGPGLIGRTFLRQLAQELDRLRRDYRLDLRVRGIASSKRMILHEQQLDLTRWEGQLQEEGKPTMLSKFVEHIHADHLPHSVIIDCTSSGEIPLLYPSWIEKGLNIITPNKKGNTLSMKFYKEIRRCLKEKKRHFLYETNVGAGLPVINTLRDLVQTGDQVLQMEGVLSGTMSFIFNRLSADHPFSEVVQEARQKGFTEPDPRDDLSGMDVARKLVILAREMNVQMELEEVTVENLVPEELRRGSVDSFLQRMGTMDSLMAARLQGAQRSGHVLRYAGVVNQQGKASVGLRAYPLTHPFAQLGATDNIIAFTTNRYKDRPLIVQGPGAGPEVTAGGVFADLLRLASYLGAS